MRFVGIWRGLLVGSLAMVLSVVGCSHDTDATSSHGSTSGSITVASTSSGSGGATGAASTSESSVTASSSSSGGAGGSLPMGTPVRVIAANLTTGNLQSYDPGEGLRILSGLKGDVMLMQEFNDGSNSPADFQSLTETICGMDCNYVRGPVAEIPNGIVSRYSIIDSGSWTDALVSNRSFVWAELDVPGDADLWAISVHLLTTNATARASEATALSALIQTNVPATDYVVIGGDFNTKARDEAALTAFDPLFAVDAPFPMDQQGNDNTSQTRTRPYDWVIANDNLHARQIPVVIGQSNFVGGAVIDTRVYQPISEIAPALVTDSAATNMQHMAVVKDFAIQ